MPKPRSAVDQALTDKAATSEKTEVEAPYVRRFAYGWKEHEASESDYSAAQILGALSMRLPNESMSLEQDIRRVRDQVTSNACTGFAVASGADLFLRHRGVVLPEPAPLGPYYFARAFERVSMNEKLVDDGAKIRLAIEGGRKFGLPSEAAWAFSPEVVNDDPKLDAIEESTTCRIQAYYTIDDIGLGRVERVCQALAAGFPVVLGTQVDRAFEEYRKGEIQPVGSNVSLGGHATLLIGYRTNADGTRAFRNLGSWGTTYGDDGFAWWSQAKLLAPETRNITVFTAIG